MNKNVVSQFERTIDKINVVYGLVIPVGTLTAAAILTWIFTPTYFQKGSLPIYIGVIVGTTVIMAFHLLRINQLTRPHILFLYGFYHLALLTFSVYVGPFISPYDFLWPILAIGMDLLYGRRYIFLTLSIYLLALLTAFIHTEQVYSTQLLFHALTQFIGVASVALLVSRFRQVSDEERTVITSSSDEKELERQRLLSLINNMHDAVVATDKNGKILVYNSALLILLDTNENVNGKDIGNIFELHDEKNQMVNFSHLIKSEPKGFASNNYTHTFGPGDKINLFVGVSPIRPGYKERVGAGYIIMMRDITKQKSLEDEQNEFINVVGHELRTPVAIAEGAIGNSLLYSQKEKVNPHIIGSLEQAHKQVKFLASMVNDISTLTRAENSEDAMKLTKINPVQFLEDLARDYQQEAMLSKLKLKTDFDKNVEPINTEELYLHEILQNFITNAIKYTHEGSVTLSVKKSDNHRVVFSVTDTGIGMSKSDQEHVFEKFYRSEDYRTRESGGTGLGLYIAAKLANKLHAEIKITSTIGVGTTFSITVSSL